MISLDELKSEVRERLSDVRFHPHFYSQLRRRPNLNAGMVLSALRDFDNYLGFQIQVVRGEVRYRIGIKLSTKYSLVVVVELAEEHLNIITAG